MNVYLLRVVEKEIDNLIEDFEKTFPLSDLLKNKRLPLIDAISDCFEKRRITEHHSAWIHNNILLHLEIEFVPKIILRKSKETYPEYMMRKWGEELGSVILLSQQAISNIAKQISFEQT
jgi:hypothetical protein